MDLKRYRKRALWILLAFAVCVPQAQQVAADEILIEQLRQDVRELARLVREQARQIEGLEREIARLKVAPAPGRPRSAPDAATEGVWLLSERWKKLRVDMPESEVVALLGPPTAVRSEAPASKTLLYTLELEGTGFLSGSVTLENARVREIREPQLR